MAASLTFPRATFAKLSPHPFLVSSLLPEPSSTTSSSPKPARTNGRQPLQARQPHINTSSLSHAHGSAVVRTGDTTVICGIRGEILPVINIPNWRPRPPNHEGDEDASARGRQELRDYDLLVPNIELATGCAPQFLPGGPPMTLAQTLSTRVASLLHSARVADIKDLEIWHTPAGNSGDDDTALRSEEQDHDEVEEVDEAQRPQLKAFWTLYIDLLFLSFDGNPFDVAWAAVLAALSDTKLPMARWDADREMVICSRTQSSSLHIGGLPIANTALVLQEKQDQDKAATGKTWLLVDPDRIEETLCDESVTMIVDKSNGKTRILGISKVGGVVVGPSQMKEYVGVAEARWDDFHKVMPS